MPEPSGPGRRCRREEPAWVAVGEWRGLQQTEGTAPVCRARRRLGASSLWPCPLGIARSPGFPEEFKTTIERWRVTQKCLTLGPAGETGYLRLRVCLGQALAVQFRGEARTPGETRVPSLREQGQDGAVSQPAGSPRPPRPGGRWLRAWWGAALSEHGRRGTRT